MFFLFPVLPVLPVLLIYAAAALLPAAVLLHYIHRHDTVEPEPPALLASLVGRGVAAALVSGVLEGIGQRILTRLVSPASHAYTILLAFVVVAMVEEGTKYALLYRATWRHPAFNYRFDGIVYAVFVSLGFAAWENIQYVWNYGLFVAIPRALLAVPGHMAFAVFMGLFYGRSKLYAGWGDLAASQSCLWKGYFAAVLLHGVYDACAMTGTLLSTILFAVFVAATFAAAYRSLKRESANDVRVT